MKISDFDHVSTEQAVNTRDGALEIAKQNAGDPSKRELCAAAWVTWKAYDAVVEYRRAQGCKIPKSLYELTA
jgi:hypothetical protein